jgi:hypothetical protein
LFAFDVDVPPAVPLFSGLMQTLIDALTAAAIVALTWIAAVLFLCL